MICRLVPAFLAALLVLAPTVIFPSVAFAESDCTDRIDNDADTLLDCADPSCDGMPCDDGSVCSTSEICTGGLCIAQATTCGDGVVDPVCGEMCEPVPGEEVCDSPLDLDGDGLVGCLDVEDCCGTIDSPNGISCSSTCQLTELCRPIIDDPAIIKFREGGQDFSKMHGRVTVSPSFNASMQTMTYLITNDYGDVMRYEIPAGALESKKAGRWRYRNRDARENGGVLSFNSRLRNFEDGLYYTFKIKTYGDYSAATEAKMATQVFGVEGVAILQTDWTKKKRGWSLKNRDIPRAAVLLCLDAQCNDGLLNGEESDIDCGGSECAACALGEQCLTDGDCIAGECVSLVPPWVCAFPNCGAGEICDEGNVCTDNECDGLGGCLVVANNSDPCDDGVFCNGADTCDAGACSINAGNPCTAGGECADNCNEVLDNCFDPPGTGCTDDGNPCTDDICDGNGACVHINNSLPCDDGLFCNGTDTCDGGSCSIHTGDPCSGGTECSDACNETADNCFDLSGTACTDDGNLCTDDVCDGAGACTHPNNTIPCDDGLFCNGTDTCSGGSCSDHTGDPCAGGTECADACNESADNCFDPGGTACTDDGNVCTDDACDGAGACAHPNNTDPCDDGLFCNGADTCDSGACAIHAGDPCVGGTQCADDCNETADNCFDLSGVVCDEGAAGMNDACDQTPDTCDGAGTCVNADPVEMPEDCSTVGDEDCDGSADYMDPDPDSICATNGTELCTCADACEIHALEPSLGGSVSLGSLVPFSGASAGSVSTTRGGTHYGDGSEVLSYSFSGVPSNLTVWWGMSDNAPHNPNNGFVGTTAPLHSVSDTGGTCVDCGDEYAGTPTLAGTTVSYTKTEAIVCPAGALGCPGSGTAALNMDTTGAAWALIGSAIDIPSLEPAALETSVNSFLLDTAVTEVTGGSLDISYDSTFNGSATGPIYDAAPTDTNEPYTVNFTGVLYGTYRNANVCP